MSDKKKNPPNPKGVGGFGERPADINRAGVSSKVRLAQHRAAEALAEAQADQAEAYLRMVQGAEGDEEKIALIKAEFNTFIKNVTDRAYGQAKSSVDLSSEDGSMTPKPSRVELVTPDLSNDDSED